MESPRTCLGCKAELPADAPAGHCPNCLLALGFDLGTIATHATQSDSRAPPPVSQSSGLHSFGDYELLEEIARGGMGIVYKARQRSLNRMVAVKMILTGHFAGKEDVLRFRGEAEAAANLRHPNIVAVFETGECEGQPYFSMEYVPGRTLEEIVREGPLPAKRAAQYAKTIAEAIHYAHSQGILHRDLKPSNVLIDANDQPRVTDFGLAKQLRGDAGLTVSGQVLGSPNFMPPEQAGNRGSRRDETLASNSALRTPHSAIEQSLVTSAPTETKVGPASDVYGIGAILYCLLTGRPPFQAGTIQEVLVQLREREPVALHLLIPSIPRDLETITLKCLEKDPARRYATAQSLADELARFLAGQPIQARPLSAPERTWRWCRRKPALAGASAAVVFAVMLGLSGVLWQSAGRQRALIDVHRLLYVSQIGIAQAALRDGNTPRAQAILEAQRPQPGQDDLRGFEWHYLRGLCRDDDALTLQGHGPVVQTLAVSPDGTILATEDDRIRLWDLRTRREIPSKMTQGQAIVGLAFSPDGHFLAATYKAGLTLWEMATQRAVSTTIPGSNVWRVAFSPDGKRVAVGNRPPDTFATVFEIPSLRLIGQLPDPGNARPCLAYSGDGRWLAIGRADHSMRLLDATTHQEKATLIGHDQPVVDLVFSSDSRILATASEDGTARLWDMATMRELGALIGHRRRVTSVAFSTNGQWLATGCIDGTIKLWDTKSRQELKTLRGHKAWVNTVCFLPDGHTLASASDDRTTRLWELNRLLTTDGAIDPYGLATVALFGPDGSTLLTGHADGAVKVHYLDSERPPEALPATGEPVDAIAMSADAEYMAVASDANSVQVWQMNPAQLLISSNLSGGLQYRLAFANDGRSLIALCGNYTELNSCRDAIFRAKFFSPLEIPASKAPLRSQQLEAVADVAVMHSDRRCLWLRPVGGAGVLAFATRDPDLEIRAYPANRLIGRLEAPCCPAVGAISPDGRFAAVRCVITSRVRVWDARQQREVISPLVLPNLPNVNLGFEFSRDGSLLAVGTDTGVVYLLKSPRFEPIKELRGHSGWVTSIAFSTDGRTMATAGNDGAVKLWNLATFRELMTMPDPISPFSNVSFSSDGRSLLCHGEDRRVRLWRVAALAEANVEVNGSVAKSTER